MGKIDKLKDLVDEIKDHHKDLGCHDKAAGASREIAFEGDAATAASCASVICEEYLKTDQGRELLGRENGAAARALLGVILVDSGNLGKKACPRDHAAATELKKVAPSPSQEELFAL